jgi:hypothetical protein
MLRHEQKIKDGAARFLEDGEQVLAAVIAAPRGSTRQAAGSMQLGSAQRARAHGAAELVDLRLGEPMGLALPHRRLLTLRIGTPIGVGNGGKAKWLTSAVPISDIDSIDVNRLAPGSPITLAARSVAIKLEANAASRARTFANTFGPVTVTRR